VPPRRESAARNRVVDAAMDLFSRQGYHATTVAQIAALAGLSPGAGGVYRHAASKLELLQEGLRRQVDSGGGLTALLVAAQPPADLPLEERLLTVARAGLRRLEQERELNRLLLRDLAAFPDLLALVRDRELRGVHAALLHWLSSQEGAGTVDPQDAAAAAAVLMGAVSHFWIMVDVFGGEHPLGVSEDRYLGVLARMAAGLLSGDGGHLHPDGRGSA